MNAGNFECGTSECQMKCLIYHFFNLLTSYSLTLSRFFHTEGCNLLQQQGCYFSSFYNFFQNIFQAAGAHASLEMVLTIVPVLV